MLFGDLFVRIAANPGPVVLDGPGQPEFELFDEFEYEAGFPSEDLRVAAEVRGPHARG